MNEADKYCKLQESIRMLKSQRSKTEINKLIKYAKKKNIDQIIRQND